MTFDVVFDRVIGHEAGYVNDPNDPGGETKWGISKRSYPHLTIKALTREDAYDIYFADFWKRIAGHQLYDGTAYQLFDFAVNSGVETAIRHFQRAVGVADDGHWGPASREAASHFSEPEQIMVLCAVRLEFMTRLKNWPAHGKGWARRIAANLQYGILDT